MDNLNVPDHYKPGKAPTEFFLKMYDWESLYDLSEDLERAVASTNSKFKKATGCDKGGEFKGMIRVTMEFVPDNA